MTLTRNIKLNQSEDKLLSTLQFIANKYPVESLSSSKTTVRCAGGWVRDKLLGLQSDDIDIVLNNCSGVDFARRVHDHFSANNGKRSEFCSSIGIIASNPSKGKHLQTATMRVMGYEVDFSHFRPPPGSTEDKMFGTPEEDALLRDFTINALYYNVETGLVEDFTERGFHDLENKTIRTPLESMKTLRDDPLRALRAVRFSVRFGFSLSGAICAAASSTIIKDLLQHQTSRGRFGSEIEGMLTGNSSSPKEAFDLIFELNLHDVVFELPRDDDDNSSTINKIAETSIQTRDNNNHEDGSDVLDSAISSGWLEAKDILRTLSAVIDAIDIDGNSMHSSHRRHLELAKTSIDNRLLYLTSFLHPFRLLNYTDARGNIRPVIHFIIQESLRFKHKDFVNIWAIIIEHEGQMRILLQKEKSGTSCKLEIGQALHQMKELWLTALVVATVMEAHEKPLEQREELIKTCISLYERTINFGLDGCWLVTPHLSGKEIMHELGIVKGPMVGYYLSEQRKWQIMNPQGDKQACIDFLKEEA
mmetsp:Transcript_25631/g.39710  ORF Transcript_25631/g.39710 Transcript_25631/m.39710 type:complete len:532 (+) Transcript_25631:274-1869(+)